MDQIHPLPFRSSSSQAWNNRMGGALGEDRSSADYPLARAYFPPVSPETARAGVAAARVRMEGAS